MKKTLEQQYKEETGLNAYEPNNMRPNIPEDVYVEWLEDKIEQLALCNVSSSLPDLAECNQASLNYATKKDNPDFFLIKQTFKEGINWALNYMTKQK